MNCFIVSKLGIVELKDTNICKFSSKLNYKNGSYIESFFEILYAKPIATKSVMIPAKTVIIKLVLIT